MLDAQRITGWREALGDWFSEDIEAFGDTFNPASADFVNRERATADAEGAV